MLDSFSGCPAVENGLVPESAKFLFDFVKLWGITLMQEQKCKASCLTTGKAFRHKDLVGD